VDQFAAYLGAAWIGLAIICRGADSAASPSGTGNTTNLLAELTKLLRAHAPPAVTREFVTTWSTPYLTSASDLLQLKSAGANPDLLTAYARRGAELRLRAADQRETARAAGEAAATNIIVYPVLLWQNAGSAEPLRPQTTYYFSKSLPWWGEAYGGQWGVGVWAYPGWPSRGHFWP